MQRNEQQVRTLTGSRRSIGPVLPVPELETRTKSRVGFLVSREKPIKYSIPVKSIGAVRTIYVPGYSVHEHKWQLTLDSRLSEFVITDSLTHTGR